MAIRIPADVKAWLLEVFGGLNEQVSRQHSAMPTTFEETLDYSLVQYLLQFRAPVTLPSGWLVRIDTHFLGGMRHFVHRFEIADIGVLVAFRQKGGLRRTKIALLQSKRLYPNEQPPDEAQRRLYEIGFARLLEEDSVFRELTKQRSFTVNRDSKYKILIVGDGQYEAIRDYQKSSKIPVHYLFYNPATLPLSVTLPTLGATKTAPPPCRVGIRVQPATDVRSALRRKPKGYQPSYLDLNAGSFAAGPHRAGWRLEHFIVNLLLGCTEGYIADSREDEGLQSVFIRRTGPLAAAIGINLDSPDELAF
jgi:hypothetical protein